MTQVSRLPPPWELLTTREPGFRATRVRPPGVTCTSGPVSTNGRRSWWARRRCPPSRIGWTESATTRWAMNARGRVDRPHHRLFEMLEHVAPVLIERAYVCVHIGQARFLVEVITNDLWDQRIHGLVVRHPVAEPVGDRDVSGPVRVHQAGRPDER